jgi:deazaflavin-dependent oxidoreductase (nitroreductase family)
MSASPSSNPPLPDWIQEHLDKYLATNGEDGHIWNGVPTLLLTTTGRKSGESIVLPLIYGKDGENPVIVASRGGAPTHPGWYRNLVAEPKVGVQVGADRFEATARTAEGEERERLWKMMAGIFPNYNEYQGRTERTIPVVVLERT